MTALTPRERFRRAPESLLLYAVSDDAWLGERTLHAALRRCAEGRRFCNFVQSALQLRSS